jgi:hypothetical protein
MPNRKKHTFPTRQYPYKKEGDLTLNENKVKNYSIKTNKFSAETINEESSSISSVMSMIVGIDNHPRPLKLEELNNLDDAFANLILKKNLRPLTLNEVLNFLDDSNGHDGGIPNQSSFLAADGGQIIWGPNTDNLNRQFRFVISRSDKHGEVLLLISASTLPDSKTQFLQLISWDKKSKAYNFYERRGTYWFWAGNSWYALKDPSRGKGPFDSHVNGALVMKELKFPWVHWHSMTASINDDVLAPDDELRKEKLWIDKLGGQEFEIQVAKPGVIKWNEARFEKNVNVNDILENCLDFFRQVLSTTTINLITSRVESISIDYKMLVRIPETFFFNKDVLMDEIGLEPNISPINFLGSHYLSSLDNFDFHIGDSEFKFKGDTHFAFLVPEPSFEDVNIISLLISKGIVSKKFIASLLMVDFSNPIYSNKRKNLLKYFPEEASITDLYLEKYIKSEVEKSELASIKDSSEEIFLRNYNLSESDWKNDFEHQIESYFQEINNLLQHKEGFYEIVKLSESRRREFRGTDLAEFRLTTPITNIPEDAPFLEITAKAIVQSK